MRIHLDTDLGGDPDDVCALALLLALDDVALVGITTNLEDGDGLRAGCAQRVLEVAGRTDVPVLAGAGPTLTDGSRFPSTARDLRHWSPPVTARPSPEGAATDALAAAVESGATIVTIGALTNLAHLEQQRPGLLAEATVVTMGGWAGPMPPGLPPWDADRDFNLVCDPDASALALPAIGRLTLVTLPATAVAHLRRRDLPRLRTAGALGELMAAQAEAYAEDTDRATLAAEHEGLPDDLLNFHWDPVTCAVATGWDGVVVEERRDLRWREGRPTAAVVAVDGPAFAEHWLTTVARLG